MKIAVIGIRGLPGVQGGVERHCENIYPRFNADTHFRIYRRRPYINAETQAAFNNISFVDLPSTRIKGFEAVFHTLLCCLHLIFKRVDIVHIHNIGPGMFTPLLRLFGMKVVLTYHSPNYEHDKWGKISKAILRLSETLSLRFANHIIFVNKFQMAKFSAKTRAKSTYMPNGIDKTGCVADHDFVDKVNALKGQYILGVGRLTPEKGFEHLIKAVNLIDEVPQLVIAGGSDHDTTYFDHLQSLNTKGKVIFTGNTSKSHLLQLYSHARMFVLSSVNEGFPLVMLEAMSFDLPMAVSDIPATRLIDLPEHYYATAADHESLANRIKEIYPTAQKVKYDLEQYDWDKIANQIHDIYTSL